MSRSLSKKVAESAACAPFRSLWAQIETSRPSRFSQVESAFLAAMREFDASDESGNAGQGDNRNGKGDFFNDLVCALLENCSGKTLSSRPSVEGLAFRKHALDGAYPAQGTVEVLLETKMLGAPKTSRNPKQRGLKGRPGSADLDKRIKEAALKTIDLKAKWAMDQGQGQGPTSELTAWLQRSKPHCVLLLAVRVVSDADLAQVLKGVDAAGQYLDSVGVYCFGPEDETYSSRPVPRSVELDVVMSKVCTRLRQLQ
jgi:hypothetical protein